MCFAVAGQPAGAEVDVPAEWAEAHRCQLEADIIPRSLGDLLVGRTKGARAVARLHVA